MCLPACFSACLPQIRAQIKHTVNDPYLSTNLEPIAHSFAGPTRQQIGPQAASMRFVVALERVQSVIIGLEGMRDR